MQKPAGPPLPRGATVLWLDTCNPCTTLQGITLRPRLRLLAGVVTDTGSCPGIMRASRGTAKAVPRPSSRRTPELSPPTAGSCGAVAATPVSVSPTPPRRVRRRAGSHGCRLGRPMTRPLRSTTPHAAPFACVHSLVGEPGDGIPLGAGDRQGRIAVHDRMVAAGIGTPALVERMWPSLMSVCSGKGSRSSASRQASIPSLRHTNEDRAVRAGEAGSAAVRGWREDLRRRHEAVEIASAWIASRMKYTITGRED